MEKFKLDNYINEKGVAFPQIASLDLVEKEAILHSLRNLIKFHLTVKRYLMRYRTNY